MDAFVGIDLAFAKRKRLPVALWEAGQLVPRRIAEREAPEPPRGAGNVAALEPSSVRRFADETATYLRRLEAHFKVSIRRVAIAWILEEPFVKGWYRLPFPLPNPLI